MCLDDYNFYFLEDSVWLQELLKEKLNPEEVFQKKGYTSQDMIDYFIQNQKAGILTFLGSPSQKFCFRIYYPNPKVIEPHIVGDVKYFRTYMKQSIDFMFVNEEIEKINVFTHLPVIGRIMKRSGFEFEGYVQKTYLKDNELLDVVVYGLQKKDYLKGR